MWGPILMRHEPADPGGARSPLIYTVVPGPTPRRPARAWRPADRRARRSRGIRGVTDLLARAGDARSTIRAEHGLAPMGCSVNEYLGGCRCTSSRASRARPHRRDLPPGVRYVGPLLWHRPSRPARWSGSTRCLQPAVGARDRGTSHYQDPFVLRAAASGLAGPPSRRSSPRRARPRPGCSGLGAGAERPRDPTGSRDALLPAARDRDDRRRGDGHGRPAAGVPLVVVPTAWDKPDSALRVVDAGVGVQVPRDAARRSGCALPSTRSSAIRATATTRRIAAALAAAPGPAGAADTIKVLAAGVSPPASPVPAFEASV